MTSVLGLVLIAVVIAFFVIGAPILIFKNRSRLYIPKIAEEVLEIKKVPAQEILQEAKFPPIGTAPSGFTQMEWDEWTKKIQDLSIVDDSFIILHEDEEVRRIRERLNLPRLR